jgi:hypothetical protein
VIEFQQAGLQVTRAVASSYESIRNAAVGADDEEHDDWLREYGEA